MEFYESKELNFKKQFLVVDTVLKNNRIYPLEIVQRAIDNIKFKVSNGNFFIRFNKGNVLNDVVGTVNRLWIDGNNCMCSFTINDKTPYGSIALALIEEDAIVLGPIAFGKLDPSYIVSELDLQFIQILGKHERTF